jgi:hypothetical protein
MSHIYVKASISLEIIKKASKSFKLSYIYEKSPNFSGNNLKKARIL